ncbi:MAG: hypothetical protein WD342_17145 [Verrucomicrobiales bacterium]
MKTPFPVPGLTVLAAMLSLPALSPAESTWLVDSQEEWEENTAASEGIALQDGTAAPTAKSGTLTTVVKSFPDKRSAKTLVLNQSPVWQNWRPVDNVGPSNLQDAPVLLSLGPDNYWIFGRHGKAKGKGKDKPDFQPEAATLEGFDLPLKTTPFPHQYDAPGGLEPGKGGYHAWQSRDMVDWVHHGPVTEDFSRWVTTAEYVDGKAYIYYDYPNDQNPHLYIDDDLEDGRPGKNMGMAFDDPSHGSDCGVIRDAEGKFHLIYEDWSPINASQRSWDSPLAGHAVSANGIDDFWILEPALDKRTRPTGKMAHYKHPHWLQHPDWDTNLGEYEIHEPEQEAFGDWAAIAVGGQYYLFGDYDPPGGHEMSVGWFTSPSLDREFTWCDQIGEGHPDPDICFAEGQFYLVTQQPTDYVSPGPWVESVSARVGVDTDNDGKADQWSGWQEVAESYDHTPGFAKLVEKTPAQLDLSDLPAGFGFRIELKVTDTTENESKPILDSLALSFGE